MSSVAIRTLSVNESIADALKGWPTNTIVRIVKTSKRTVENWKQARTGPQAKHIAAMMADDDLCAAILPALGRPELAHSQKILTAEKNLAALKTLNQRINSAKAATQAAKEKTNEIRRSIEALGSGVRTVAGAPSHTVGGEVEPARRVVPGQDR